MLTLALVAPLALAHGAPASAPTVEAALAAEAAATAFRGHHPVAEGDAVWIAWRGLVWTLALREREGAWVLELGDHPHRMDPVARWGAPPAEDPALLWAGDLDGDDLLDVVVETAEGRRLRLSSRSPAVATD